MKTFLCLILLAVPVTAQTITVNQAQSHQTITGWEAVAQTGKGDFPSSWPNYIDSLIEQAVDDGINRVKINIRTGAEFQGSSQQNDNSNPYLINPAGFRWNNRDGVDEMADAADRLCDRLWTVKGERCSRILGFVDFGNGAGLIHANSPEEYAELIQAGFLHLYERHGWVPNIVEIILEPDHGSNAHWTATKLVNCILATQKRLAGHGWFPKFLVPSVTNGANMASWWSNMKAVNTDWLPFVDEAGFHRYGSPSQAQLDANQAAAEADGKRLAMTEFSSGSTTGPPDYATLHADLRDQDVAAWEQFTIGYDNTDNGNHYYTINHSTFAVAPTSRFRFIRHYFKWIRRGAVRKGATTGDSNFDAVAFRNVKGNYVVVVKCATGGGSFTVGGLPGGTYHLRYTTNSATMTDPGDQTIGSGQNISTSIPAAGVLTIYADAPPTVNYYASPTGSGTTCSDASPCPLSYLLSASSPINSAPCTNVGNLKGGTYPVWGVKSFLNGTTDCRAVLQSKSGEWARIDGYGNTTLTAGVNTSTTTFTVVSTDGIEVGDFALIDSELVYLSAVVNATTLTVIRANGGTTAASHSGGAILKNANPVLKLESSETDYRDFEILHGDPSSASRALPAPYVVYPRPETVWAESSTNDRLINLIIHDGREGVFKSANATNLELHGLVLFNGGFVDPSRGHGHGTYLQNGTGSTVAVFDSISTNFFATTSKAFGEGAPVLNVTYSGNILFNAGSPAIYAGSPYNAVGGLLRRENSLLIGAAVQPAENAVIASNYLYTPRASVAGNLQMGYQSVSNISATVTNNMLMTGATGLIIEKWATLNFWGNTVQMTNSALVGFDERLVSYEPSAGATVLWNNNTYWNENGTGYSGFSFNGARLFAGWKSATGFDANSTETGTAPTGQQVFIRPNQFESGRAHIAVYNWSLSPTVTVNLTQTGLTNGQTYQIKDASNFFGPVIASGTFSAASPSINISTNLTAVATPIGHVFTPAHTAPEFFALVVLPTPTSATPPSAPSGLIATNGSGNNINLSWSDNSTNETGFKVERKLGVGGSYSEIGIVGANTSSFADNSSKTANRPYIYRVRATNGSGDSAYTNEDDATTPFTGAVNNFRTDMATYIETPTTMPLPLAGGKFYDETFGTQIMRFTGESDGADFGTTYSVWPTPNSDNTKLWIFNSVNNSYHIGTLNPVTFTRVGALSLVANAPASIFAHLEAAVWSTTDPDKIFILVDAKIYFYRPSTNTYTLVKSLTSNFPAGYYFNQLYVSSDNTRFAAMMKSGSGDQGFMVYDSSTDTVIRDVRTTDVNGITMDKSGQWVLLVPDSDPNQYIYNVDTGARETLVSSPITGLPDFKIGHNDTGTDLVFGEDQWHGAISVRKMSTPHSVTTAWTYAPFWINFHISGRANNENWGLMSTYGDTGVSADPAKFRREIFQVGLQGGFTGQLRRLVHSRANWSVGGIRTVTGATNASPIVITTSAAHNFQTGQRLQMSGIGGNTAANGFFYITVINSTQFSLNSSAGNGSYTSGGTAYLETYWDSPRANISRDGKYTFWTSNWNGIVGGGRKDLYIALIEGGGTRICRWSDLIRC